MLKAYFRADSVYKTGVVQPDPIRTLSPVEAARGVIPQFVNAVRPMGPQVNPLPVTPAVRPGQSGLGDPHMPQKLANYGAKQRAEAIATQAGARPVIISPQPGGVAIRSNAKQQVMKETLPNRAQSLYGRMLAREAALSRGSFWDQISAQKRLVGLQILPGLRKGQR